MTNFKVGDGGEIGGIRWRIVQGTKARADMRLEIYSPSWIPAKHALALLMYDLFQEVEDILYPRPKYRGRYKIQEAFSRVSQWGWEEVAKRIEEERAAKRERGKK